MRRTSHAIRRQVVRVGILAGGLLTLSGAAALQVDAQTGEPRIWQGVYTDEQAARGKEVFTANCVRCHAQDLAGVTGPALKGDRFYQTFGSEPIDRLFLKVRDTMPPNYGDTVTDQNKLDAVTYILQYNGFPSGPGELKMASEDLATAQILRKGERAVVQNFSLVSAVGCLARGDNNTWLLTRTADPVSTRDDTSTPQALATAATRPLGTRTFRLLSAVPFKPEAHVGHRMEARGLIYNDDASARLTVISLQVAAETCG
jgi:S-disulfanyl-L-cysteine oxidoreductase SoxD